MLAGPLRSCNTLLTLPTSWGASLNVDCTWCQASHAAAVGGAEADGAADDDPPGALLEHPQAGDEGGDADEQAVIAAMPMARGVDLRERQAKTVGGP